MPNLGLLLCLMLILLPIIGDDEEISISELPRVPKRSGQSLFEILGFGTKGFRIPYYHILFFARCRM
jgi:hypothetical protein